MTPRARNLIQLNAAVLIWGGTAMFAKGIALPVGPIIGCRALIAAAVLFVFLRARRAPLGVKRPAHLGVMLIIGSLMCLHLLTYFQALKVSTAAVAILALHTYPVLTALIEPVIFKEKLKAGDVLLAGGVLAGLVIMTPAIDPSNSTTRGIALGIVSGVLFTARNLMTRKYVRQYSGSALMFWQMLVTGLLLLPVLGQPESGAYTPRAGVLLLVLGIFFTAIPHALYAASFKNLSAKTIGVLATLLPFYGALFGYWIHDETVTPRTVAGGLIIIACIAVETVRSATSAPPPADTEAA